MKMPFALICTLALAAPAFAKGGSGYNSGSHASSPGSSHSVSSYTKSNGTYVAPSHATNSNATKADNWSTKGNVNPYTGKAGTK